MRNFTFNDFAFKGSRFPLPAAGAELVVGGEIQTPLSRNRPFLKVRRASDNSHRDFFLRDLTNGRLKHWVNATVDLPLDTDPDAGLAMGFRRLGATVDGVVCILRRNVDGATRAFSDVELEDGTALDWIEEDMPLPLVTDPSAPLAHSLRWVGDVYTGPVVQGRRSSDGAVRDFFPDEIRDGTLMAWANEDVTRYESDFSSGVDGWFAINSAGLSAVDSELNISSATGIRNGAGLPNIWQVGCTFRVRARIRRVSGDDPIIVSFRTSATWSYENIAATPNLTSTGGNNGYQLTLSGTEEEYIEFTVKHLGGTSANLYVAISTPTETTVVRLYDVEITQLTSNVTVPRWYGQDADTNDAVAPDLESQPYLVRGGEPVLDPSTGKPAIYSNGTTNRLLFEEEVSYAPSQSGFSIFGLAHIALGASHSHWQHILGTRVNVGFSNSVTQLSCRLPSSITAQGILSISESPVPSFAGVDFDHETGRLYFWRNGVDLEQPTRVVDVYSGNPRVLTGLFARRPADMPNAESYTECYASELIFYDSYKGEERRSIESNQARYYEVSIPDRQATVTEWVHQPDDTVRFISPEISTEPVIYDGGWVELNSRLAMRFEEGQRLDLVEDGEIIYWIGPPEDEAQSEDDEVFLVSSGSDTPYLVSELMVYPQSSSGNFNAIKSNIGDYHNINMGEGINAGEVNAFIHTLFTHLNRGDGDLVINVASDQPQLVKDGEVLDIPDFSGPRRLSRDALPYMSIDKPFSVYLDMWLEEGFSNGAILTNNVASTPNDKLWVGIGSGGRPVLTFQDIDTASSGNEVEFGRQTTGAAPSGTPFSLLITYDGSGEESGIKLYIDGEDQSGAGSGAGAFSGDLMFTLGGRAVASGNATGVHIMNCRVYPFVISAS